MRPAPISRERVGDLLESQKHCGLARITVVVAPHAHLDEPQGLVERKGVTIALPHLEEHPACPAAGGLGHRKPKEPAGQAAPAPARRNGHVQDVHFVDDDAVGGIRPDAAPWLGGRGGNPEHEEGVRGAQRGLFLELGLAPGMSVALGLEGGQRRQVLRRGPLEPQAWQPVAKVRPRRGRIFSASSALPNLGILTVFLRFGALI